MPFWGKSIGIEDFSKLDFNDFLQNNSEYSSQLFHYPMRISLKGKEIPGVSIQHHAAHAASAFYNSNFSKSAVITHDGGFYETGPLNGMIFLGYGFDTWQNCISWLRREQDVNVLTCLF